MPTDDLSRRIASAARTLQDEGGSLQTLERALRLAIEMVEDCEHAGVTLVRRGRFESPAVSHEVVRRVDALQYEHQEGPCVDAILEDELVHSRDLAHDTRWPAWGPRTARETGIRSMMCFRLFTRQDTVGALNLYSSEVGAFDAADREEGLALAAHVALAFVASQQIESLHQALDSRTEIAQAIGLLMERYGLEDDQAFAVLRRVSQESQRKLRDVAHELLSTRRLPNQQ